MVRREEAQVKGSRMCTHEGSRQQTRKKERGTDEHARTRSVLKTDRSARELGGARKGRLKRARQQAYSIKERTRQERQELSDGALHASNPCYGLRC